MPVVVYLPDTTQELDPIPLPLGPSSAGILSRVSESEESWLCMPWSAPWAVAEAPSPPAAGRWGSNFPVALLYEPSSTMGRWVAEGYAGYRSLICWELSRLVISARSISSCMLPRRSQAIALSQATESTGDQASGA